jgi:hypothetical protein
MAKRKGLPKKYAKMGFKRGWKAYKRSKRIKTTTRKYKPVRTYKRRNPYMARRKKYYRRAKSTLMNKSFIDGIISVGGKKLLGGFLGANPLYYAGFDVALGYIRKNKTLMGQGIANGILTFLPFGNGSNGGVR